MSTEALERAFASTRGVLTNVTPDEYDLSTPCESWTVRDIINHVVSGSHWFGTSMREGVAPPIADRDVLAEGSDLMAFYDEGIAHSLDAFGAPGAEEKIVTLPYGEFPGAIFMGLATSDQFTHGWDLASATGQSRDLDPGLATQLLELAKLIPEEFRGPDGIAPFGSVIELPDSAPAADRLAAYLGRTP
ncbi:MAG: TIGR03086 family metal-binding protein [Acidimicrobiia bacterium]